MKTAFAPLVGLLVLGLLSPAALAVITIGIDDEDSPGEGDTLHIPDIVHEIGQSTSFGGIFPEDESLRSSLQSGGPGSPWVLVTILNLSSTDWAHVWYIADAGTNIRFYDGVVQPVAVPAFKIDAVGVHTPLRSESISENGIWEQGEAWTFLIQGYSNSSGLFASEFNSIGIDSGSSSSSGSIVAIVPEPGVTLLSLLSLGCMLAARRR